MEENGLVDLQEAPEEEHPPQQIQELPFSLLVQPYTQMIMEAIEALSHDAKGCSKTTIAKHIEATQTHLPPSHLTLLNYHLNQMKESGQIVISKNNYMKKPDQPNREQPHGDSRHVAEVTTSPSVYSLRLRGPPPPTLTEEGKNDL